jgi:hypothetical protein
MCRCAGENHVLEKQQILKHQLKATFSMQKHQMHYRHEKETEQLAAFHVQKLTDLDKKFAGDLRLLPKVQHRVCDRVQGSCERLIVAI